MALDETLESRLRRKLGDNDSSNPIFTTEELEDIYTEASEQQSETDSIFQQAIVIGYEELLADSAKLTNYKANHASENLSDIFKHLEKLLKYHQDKLAGMEATAAGSPIRIGALRRRADRAKDIPNA